MTNTTEAFLRQTHTAGGALAVLFQIIHPRSRISALWRDIPRVFVAHKLPKTKKYLV